LSSSKASSKPRFARIEIAKEYLGFSAGHFTIFDAARRENLHGHSFRIGCEVVAPVADDGLCFDYGLLKKLLRGWCDELDEHLLLPGTSPYLSLREDGGCVHVRFADESMHFLARDVRVLPVANITVEALAHWLLGRLRAEPLLLRAGVREIVARVSSGAGQWGSASWRAGDEA
jgi:6-pyruvoyltetrahydropterin/6-carboxytetrahydropterin synthase